MYKNYTDLRMDDSDAPAMAYMGKQIRKCAISTKPTSVNKPINIRSKKECFCKIAYSECNNAY